MNTQDYAKIIKESPIPSCCVNLYIKNNKIKDIIVYEVNDEMEKMLSNNRKDIIGKSLGSIINTNLEKFELDNIVKQCIDNNGYSIEGYIYRLNDYYKLNIKSIDNERFIIWFIKTDEINECIKNIIINSDEMMWIRNKNGKYMLVSEKYKEVMKTENPEGKYLHEVLTKDATIKSSINDKEVIDGKKDYVVKYTVENGVWYRSKIKALKSEDGKIIGTIGIAKDITNNKNKEYEKDCKIKILENLIDNVSDTFYYKDLNGKYKIWNKQFEYYNNRCKPELENYTVDELSSDMNFIDKIKSSDKNVIETKKAQKIETVVSIDGAKKKFFELVKSPVFDEDNKVIGIVGVGRDISDRKINEEKSKLDNSRLEEIAENIQDILFICENGKAKYISNYCEKMLGVKDEEIYCDIESIRKYIHPEDMHLILDIDTVKNIDRIIRVQLNSQTKWIWIRGNSSFSQYN
ncbi:MAG: PAS domain-containing protein, partial [Paraclostridium sp.]